MEHTEFVQSWNEGKLLVDINRTKALQIANSRVLSKRYQIAHIFWSWVWILTIPLALAIMFLYKWWAGLLILLFVTPAVSSATKKSVMQFMIDHALENPEFYQFAVTEGIIRIRPKP